MNIEITAKEAASDEERARIVGGLIGYNDAASSPEQHHELTVTALTGGELAGGLIAFTHWNWLFLKQLWIADEIRGFGVGKRLVLAAEEEAVRRGCQHAHCDTFSFQALGFYQRLGYTIFGRLEDYPPGHSRFYLQKRNIGEPAVEAQGTR